MQSQTGLALSPNQPSAITDRSGSNSEPTQWNITNRSGNKSEEAAAVAEAAVAAAATTTKKIIIKNKTAFVKSVVMVLASVRYHHVTLFKSVVFLDVQVQVVATDDNGPLHIHLLENKTTTTPM